MPQQPECRFSQSGICDRAEPAGSEWMAFSLHTGPSAKIHGYYSTHLCSDPALLWGLYNIQTDPGQGTTAVNYLYSLVMSVIRWLHGSRFTCRCAAGPCHMGSSSHSRPRKGVSSTPESTKVFVFMSRSGHSSTPFRHLLAQLVSGEKLASCGNEFGADRSQFKSEGGSHYVGSPILRHSY